MDETTVEETAAELPPIEIPDVEQANQYVEMLMEMAVGYGPRLALALATLFRCVFRPGGEWQAGV